MKNIKKYRVMIAFEVFTDEWLIQERVSFAYYMLLKIQLHLILFFSEKQDIENYIPFKNIK